MRLSIDYLSPAGKGSKIGDARARKGEGEGERKRRWQHTWQSTPVRRADAMKELM